MADRSTRRIGGFPGESAATNLPGSVQWWGPAKGWPGLARSFGPSGRSEGPNGDDRKDSNAYVPRAELQAKLDRTLISESGGTLKLGPKGCRDIRSLATRTLRYTVTSNTLQVRP